MIYNNDKRFGYLLHFKKYWERIETCYTYNDKQQTISNIGRGLKPISKGQGCKKIGQGLKILQ